MKVKTGNGTIDLNEESLAKGVYTYALIIDGITQESKRMIVELKQIIFFKKCFHFK